MAGNIGITLKEEHVLRGTCRGRRGESSTGRKGRGRTGKGWRSALDRLQARWVALHTISAPTPLPAMDCRSDISGAAFFGLVIYLRRGDEELPY